MSEPQAPVEVGQILDQKYRVDRILGVGGMGVVVAATHVTLDEKVAIKFLLPDAKANPEVVNRFAREARAASKIKGEHVARVSDVGTLATGEPYMVMEYLQGNDLAAEIEKRGKIPPPEAVSYVLQACSALAEAHGLGIVHRDLKPANLFLTRRPDGTECIKVLDFGISKMAAPGSNDAGLTRTQSSMGSPLYMSPEQMTSSKNVDARADIWSMGVVLYELLSGTSPFLGETLPEVCAKILQETPAPLTSAEIPAELAAVVQRCLQKSPAARFASMGELAAALVPFANEEGRIAAKRIRRLQGGPDASISRPSLPLVSAPAISVAAPGAVTNASVETSIPINQPRSRTPLFVALGGVVLLLLVGGGMALRGNSGEPVGGTNPPEPATTASAILIASAALESSIPAVVPVTSASASAAPASDPPPSAPPITKNAGVKAPATKTKVPSPTTNPPSTRPAPAGDRRGEDRH